MKFFGISGLMLADPGPDIVININFRIKQADQCRIHEIEHSLEKLNKDDKF